MSFKESASFSFNINPGFPVKNARKAKEHPNPDESIFNTYQLSLIEKLIAFNVQNQLEEAQVQFQKESEEAYQKGVKAGFQQCQQQLQAQVNQSVKIFNQILNNISSQYEHISEEQEQNLLEFIINLSRKVIDTELEINPEIILNVLKNALNLLNEREELKILVNPKDWLTVKDNINRLNLRIDLPKQIEIINTADISPGGCRLEFKSGSIDADIDTQFAEIKRKLLKYAK